MHSKDIRLTDDSILEIQINFLTLYLIKEKGIDKKTAQIKRLEEKLKKIKNKKDPQYLKTSEKLDDIQLQAAAWLIYAILRSNKRKVDFEEALMLCPADPEEIKSLVYEFMEQMEKFKKKEDMKM